VQSLWWNLEDRGFTAEDITTLLAHVHGSLRQLADSDRGTDAAALLQMLQMLQRLRGNSGTGAIPASSEIAEQCDQLGITTMKAMLAHGPGVALWWGMAYVEKVAYVARLLSALNNLFWSTVRYRRGHYYCP
jgi:hypothetical protein